jgi:hypothetical protein
MAARILVVRRGSVWSVVREGGEEIMHSLTLREAIDAGSEIARHEEVELVIESGASGLR